MCIYLNTRTHIHNPIKCRFTPCTSSLQRQGSILHAHHPQTEQSSFRQPRRGVCSQWAPQHAQSFIRFILRPAELPEYVQLLHTDPRAIICPPPPPHTPPAAVQCVLGYLQQALRVKQWTLPNSGLGEAEHSPCTPLQHQHTLQTATQLHPGLMEISSVSSVALKSC